MKIRKGNNRMNYATDGKTVMIVWNHIAGTIETVIVADNDDECKRKAESLLGCRTFQRDYMCQAGQFRSHMFINGIRVDNDKRNI
jgi:hypothetical protein